MLRADVCVDDDDPDPMLFMLFPSVERKLRSRSVSLPPCAAASFKPQLCLPVRDFRPTAPPSKVCIVPVFGRADSLCLPADLGLNESYVQRQTMGNCQNTS